jgi:hypothetical protein
LLPAPRLRRRAPFKPESEGVRVSAEPLYRRIPVAIWGDFAGLSDSAIVLALRLRAGPETMAIPGIVIAGRAGLAEALGWPLRRLDAAYRELETRGIARADWAARLVYVPAAIAETPPANPSVVTGWRSAWVQVPACGLRDEVQRALWGAVAGRGDAFKRALCAAIGDPPSGAPSATPSATWSPTPCPTPCPTPSPTPWPTQEEEEEEDTDKDKEGGGGDGPSLPPVDLDSRTGALKALRSAYHDVRGSEIPFMDPREIERHMPTLLAVGDQLGPIARLYYSADGNRPGDTYWRDRGWPLHLLATQAIPSLAERARAPSPPPRERSRKIPTLPPGVPMPAEMRAEIESRRGRKPNGGAS